MNNLTERISITPAPLQTRALEEDTRSGLSTGWMRWFVEQVWDTITGLLNSQQILNAAQANLPTDLGTPNAGYLVYVTDYAHLLMWTGAGWQWGPGEAGSDFALSFPLNAPSPLTGWHLCDGTAGVNVLKSDGTLAARNLPVTANTYYRL